MNFRRTSFLLLAGALWGLTQAQQWNDFGGNTINGTEYLGANTGSTVPLLLKTVPNLSVDFSTHDRLRMRLYGSVSGTTINGFTGLRQNGFVGISPQPLFFTSTVGPFSRLHLVDSSSTDALHYAQQYGFRPWQRNGITFTGNQDQAYIGHKYSGSPQPNDSTDMVIQWSDNGDDSPWPTDRLRFLFTTSYNSSRAYGARSLEGLESFRVFVPNDTSAFVGVGDFYKATVLNGMNMVDPDERLHILDRTIRIQRLVPDYFNDTLSRVVVVDTSGRLHWRYASGIGSTGGGVNDCDWVVDPVTQDISTAYSGSSCPWDNSNNVGIGTATPVAKLELIKDVDTPGSNEADGIYVDMSTQNIYNRGVHAKVYGTTQVENTGGRFYATNAGVAYGVQGIGDGSSVNFGVFGSARANATANYGVYGEASGGSTNWAGYFDGRVNITGALYINGVFALSDQSIKTGITPLTGALGLISQLNPTTYEFVPSAVPGLDLPTGQQFGLIAQELEAVLPTLVSERELPTTTDADGLLIQPTGTLKAVDYQSLIPVLIGAIQEQQAQIATLQAAVASCCSAPPTDTDSRSLNAASSGSSANETKLTIQPNPFVDRTTLTYTLDRSGQVLLVVTTATGRQVQVLREGQAENGTYTFEWETSALSSGMYNVTLLLDGEVVTKKAVKL